MSDQESTVWLSSPDDRTLIVTASDGSQRVLEVDPSRPRTPVHSTAQAITAHAAYDQWLTTESALFNAACLRAVYASPEGGSALLPVDAAFPEGSWKDDPTVRGWLDLHAMTARRATTWFMSTPMGDLLEQLVAANDGPTTLNRSDVPEPCGALWLETPWEPLATATAPLVSSQMMGPLDAEAWRRYLRARGLLWVMVEPGALKFTLPSGVDLELTDAGGPLGAVRERGGVLTWPLIDAGSFLVEHDAWRNMERPPVMTGELLALPFGAVDSLEDRLWYDVIAKRVTTLFRLIWQKVLPPETAHVDRATARRISRTPFGNGRSVTVTHIRRYAPRGSTVDHDLGTGVRLDHPVIVRGHWRDQWYRSLGPARLDDDGWNPESHRRIWIDAHIRGHVDDDHRPEIPRRATAVVR